MTTLLPRAERIGTPLEKYQLGEIAEVHSIDPRSLNIGAELAPHAIYAVEVQDPYVDMYSAWDRVGVKTLELSVNNFARDRREAGLWERRHGTAYVDGSNEEQIKGNNEWGDPVSTKLFFDQTLQSPGIDAWRTKIPSAKALADIADPYNNQTVTNSEDESVFLDETGRKWLSLCTDAVGIRSRGTIMAEAVKEFVAEQQNLTGDITLEGFCWMSIACGTALPAMKAAMHAGVSPELVLVDTDKGALRATQELASEIGYTGMMSQSRTNIFNPDCLGRLRDKLVDRGARPMLIDLMGIFEYTGENLGVDPVTFLSSVYDILQPGGRMVFGQMRDDRPVADFTMGVVGWPYVEMRSPKQFLEIIQKAGIPVSATQLYLPNDGVYTVGVIDKPRSANQ